MNSVILMAILLVVSILLIIAVMLQPGKSDGLSGSITGGAEQLFGKKRAKPYESVLHKSTIVLTVFYFAVAIAAVVLTN